MIHHLLGANLIQNKKVLRECKRHTACHVASAHYAALSRGGTWDGVPPYPNLDGVPPPPRPEMGYLPPPTQTWDGVTPLPRPEMGYPPTQTWDGVAPYLDLGQGTPRKCGQTENITSRHPSDAGGNNVNEFFTNTHASESRVSDLNSRCPRFNVHWDNILLLVFFCFYIVKPLMQLLSLLSISVNLWKNSILTRIDETEWKVPSCNLVAFQNNIACLRSLQQFHQHFFHFVGHLRFKISKRGSPLI